MPFNHERERPRYPYLTIMGPTGVGKTVLAERMAGPLGCLLFTEEAATTKNPFLARSYKDPERWSFHSQISFLLDKFEQLEKIWPLRFQGSVLHEPPIFEDVEVYARERLKGPEWEIYQDLYQTLTSARKYPQPDLVIYLQADLGHIMARIERRAKEEGKIRKAELRAPPEYWQAMIRLNEAWATRETKIPVLGFDTNHLNIVDSQTDQEEIIEEIRQGVYHELWQKKGGISPDGSQLILQKGFII